MNISKDQTLVKLKKKSNDVNIHNSQIEPFSPWPNQVEQNIRDQKKDFVRKMMKTSIHKKLWENCIDFEAYVRSNI